jgi:hypothetical protein
MFLLGTIVIAGIVIGVMSLIIDEKPKHKKPWKKNISRKRSIWDKDPFFGTPLQKI